MRDFYLVSYCGDKYAATTLAEAFELASLEPSHVGHWTIVEAKDAGAARLSERKAGCGWVQFETDREGNVIGGAR